MQIRKAKKEDFDCIKEIYVYARKVMKENGNYIQWKDSYPSDEIIKVDIEKKQLYVCEENNQVEAVFMYTTEIEPTYVVIEGKWLNDLPYGTMHRVASAGRIKGVSSMIFNWCYEQCKNLKADTHENNKIMQHLFDKNGFKRCGIVTLKDGTKRIGYQKV
jgi:hypothetical protein